MDNIRLSIEKCFRGEKDGVFLFLISADFPAFNGHFPDSPVLPGIVQIDIVLFCIGKFLNKNKCDLKEVQKVKFQKAVLPETLLEVFIKADGDSFLASIKSGQEQICQMKLIVES